MAYDNLHTGTQSGKIMYDSPHQFEPLMLTDRQLEQVLPVAEKVVASSIALRSAVHESTRATLRELVRHELVLQQPYRRTKYSPLQY